MLRWCGCPASGSGWFLHPTGVLRTERLVRLASQVCIHVLLHCFGPSPAMHFCLCWYCRRATGKAGSVYVRSLVKELLHWRHNPGLAPEVTNSSLSTLSHDGGQPLNTAALQHCHTRASHSSRLPTDKQPVLNSGPGSQSLHFRQGNTQGTRTAISQQAGKDCRLLFRNPQ